MLKKLGSLMLANNFKCIRCISKCLIIHLLIIKLATQKLKHIFFNTIFELH